MANKNPNPATRFQKGNQLSKGKGRPPMTAAQKALALENRTELKNVMSKYMTLTAEEIELTLEDKSLAVIDIAILKHLQDMVKHGSMERMDWIVDHIMGSRATKVEVKATSGIDLSKLSEEELLNLQNIAEKSQ